MWRGRVTKVLFQVVSSETMVMKVRDVEGKSNEGVVSSDVI